LNTDKWIGYQNGTGITGSVASNFGYSVSMTDDGNRMIVGAPSYSSTTATFYDLSYNNETWSSPKPYSTTDISMASALFGSAVAINPVTGNRLLVSALNYNTRDILAPYVNRFTGAVFDFSFNNNNWNSIPKVGPNILADPYGSNGDNFGKTIVYAVNPSNTAEQMCLIGIPKDGSGNNGTSNGKVFGYLLNESGSNYWGQATESTSTFASIDFQITSPLTSPAYDRFGAEIAVSSNGLILAIGSPNYNSGDGIVYTYYAGGFGSTFNSNVLIAANASGEAFGSSVALDASGTRLIVGAPGNNSGIGTNYVYNYVTVPNPAWVLESSYKTGLNAGDRAGSALAINATGSRFVSGAPKSTSSAPPYKEGHAYIYDRQMECDALVWNGINWVAGGKSSKPLVNSPDGINWQDSSNNSAITTVNALAANSNLTLAGGISQSNVIAYSTDGGLIFNNSTSDSNILKNYYSIDGTNNFGLNLAMNSNKTILAVQTLANSSFVGSVSIYNNNNSNWSLSQTLNNFDLSINNITMNANGTVLIISQSIYNNSNGKLLTYNNINNIWTQTQSIIPSTSSNYQFFSRSVALDASGSVMAVGAYYYNNIGRVYVYSYNFGTALWNSSTPQLIDPVPSSNPSGFGTSISMDQGHNYMVVGAPYYNGYNGGAVYIYNYNFGTSQWNSPPQLITGSNNYGNVVAFNAFGTVLGVQSPYYNSSMRVGAIYLYNYNSGAAQWGLNTTINNPDNSNVSTGFGDTFKFNAAGTVLAVGAPIYNGTRGIVYVYTTTNGTWSSTPTYTINNPNPINNTDIFGTSIVLDSTGTFITIGAQYYNNYNGRIYIYNNYTFRQCNAIASNTNVWVAGGASYTNSLSYSLDGMTWVPSTNGTTGYPFSGGSCNAVAWNGSIWVAGGTGTQALAYSSDGQSWYQSSFTDMSQCNGITWNGTYWLATGSGVNTMASSVDGILWLGNGDILFSSGNAISSRRVLTPTSNVHVNSIDASLNFMYNKGLTYDASLNSIYNKNKTYDASINKIDLSLNSLVNQVWSVDIKGTGNRTLNGGNTTNTTGRPIMYAVTVDMSNNVTFSLQVSSVPVLTLGLTSTNLTTGTIRQAASAMVPVNSTYGVTTTGAGDKTLVSWYEFS
jgi:hypothetical protein